jgi:hypothetical protein
MAARTRQNPADTLRKRSNGKRPAGSARYSPREENISVRTFEDQATDRDRLGFEPYVKAIAKFLTNRDTKPPLVLSIEGEWGSGKTSFMLQLRNELKEYSTVWFDPWRYDKEEELWAVFASYFIDEVIHSVPGLRRIMGHVRRFIRRYRWREGWFALTTKTVIWVGLLILVLVMGRNALFLGNQWVENIYNWLANENTDFFKTFIETGIRLGGVTGFIVLLLFTVGKLMPIIEDPLKVDLRKYISSPNYEDRVPFIKRFQDDFKEILDIYIGKQKIFVFVDDLDRCEVPKAADVMSAINLMIGDDNRVVFVIAMDREKVAAGLAVKYEKLLPYMLVSRAYNRSTFSNRELIGLEFGYEFIEKFVQLPFRIPQPDADKIDNLLGEIQQARAAKGVRSAFLQTWLKDRFASLARVFRATGGAATNGKGTISGPKPDPNKTSESNGGEDAANKERRESIIIQTGPETASFIAIVKQVAGAFDYNPRRIKQFINLFRLRVFIAAETGLFDDDPNTTEDYPLTLEKIAKLTALELRWPIFVADIQGDTSTLTDLQQLAYGITLKAVSPRVELWRTRQDLMNFLKIGFPASATDKRAIQGLWDLSTVNLTRLMRVSPRIHEINPFVPGEPGGQPPAPEPVPGMPAEYISVDGRVKHNLAGEFCVSYIGRDNIYDFLKKWKEASPGHYDRILGGDNDRPTSIEDVRNMLGVYGYQTSAGHLLNFKDGLMDPKDGMDFSPRRFAQILETHYLMAGVRIEQKAYQLASQGIVIWVVLDGISQEGNDEARVEIYNPYTNGKQAYSYSQFISSLGEPSSGYGLWVQRQRGTVDNPQIKQSAGSKRKPAPAR